MADISSPSLGPTTTEGAGSSKWSGWLSKMSAAFDGGVVSLNKQLQKSLEDIEKDPANPMVLTNYQKHLSEYTLYRNAQSTTVKAFKEIDSMILQNSR